MTKRQRSERMSLVKYRDTKPELRVRRALSSLGVRYRVHAALPGRPDIVFKDKVVFVHGCFWHRHRKTCPLTRMPKSRLEFWSAKFEGNRKRDERNKRRLRRDGFKVLVVWECELVNMPRVTQRLKEFAHEVA